MDNVENNYKYFCDNMQRYLQCNEGKYVLIHDCSDAGFFDTFDDSLKHATKAGYELGTFLIQKCTNKPEEDAAIFYSRVGVFNS